MLTYITDKGAVSMMTTPALLQSSTPFSLSLCTCYPHITLSSRKGPAAPKSRRVHTCLAAFFSVLAERINLINSLGPQSCPDTTARLVLLRPKRMCVR